MKHSANPRTTILRETEGAGVQSPSPNPSKHRPPSSASARKQKWSKENSTPSDLNSATPDPSPSASGKHVPPPSAGKLKSPLPPRPPSSNPNPLKRKLNLEAVAEGAIFGPSDSGVKVMVRMRPPHKDEDDGEAIVQKASGDSLSILGQTFTFDSVADAEATQMDIFQLVGAPVVEHCLAGFNSSVFAYGQTGSGKTYTMWGPANALLERNALSDQQGLTPRVLERLFARINEEQIKQAHKHLKYQCRCSFLEIYNEQITDLLEPNQRNLQIREDVKSGVYVENLTEECVHTMKDVTQLLTKGLSNRRTGATSMNAESSRSHSVFTCVVESQCKSTADGISSVKTSRINLVDLAGSERQKLTGAAGERLKEAGNINRSLSQLGNLINILAEVSQTGKQRHIPYRDSRLTFLLQESLGGNAKLAMVCAISPAPSCKSETFSTLRFAQRAKAIKNKAVVNEVMQEDVNFLREVIRQLKDELVRMKANGIPNNAENSYSTGWNARRSLNLLKFSLSRPTTLPHEDNDGDEEMEIDEEAVERLYSQASLQSDVSEKNNSLVSKPETLQLNSKNVVSEEVTLGQPHKCIPLSGCVDEDFKDTDVNMDDGVSEQSEKYESMNVDPSECGLSADLSTAIDDNGATRKPADQSLACPLTESDGGLSTDLSIADSPNNLPNDSVHCVASSLSIVPCEVSPVLKSPTPSVSPRISVSGTSLKTASVLGAPEKEMNNDCKASEVLGLSFAKSVKSSTSNYLSLRTSKNFPPTEHLAASLHRGLEILECHHQSSALRRSSFRFSFKAADIRPLLPIEKVEVGVQTLPESIVTADADKEEVLCSKCKARVLDLQPDESNDIAKLQLVPVDGSHSDGKSKKQVPKAVEKVLAGSIRREMALEEICAKQASELMQLNRLVQQYKHERECNAIIGQTREDKILRLENLMDGVLPTEDFMEEELLSLKKEHELLKEKYENDPQHLSTKIELKRCQDELEQYRNFFNLGEREVLLEEIQDLRSQLQYYVDSSPAPAQKRSPILQLTYSSEPSSAPSLGTILESTEESAEEKLEQERIRWTESESKWISLAEELKCDLEVQRSKADKLKQELYCEKKCSEELKEAMQLAMEGHARMLEQYADLEEKHMEMLARQRKIQEGISDVKSAAAKAGFKGIESRFISSLAAEISTIKVEREKERRYLRDEIKGLQAQLRDTAEAVQAAGELLVRLKEAEESVAAAEKRAIEAEQQTEKACKQIDKLKRRKLEKEESCTLNQLNQSFAESRLPKAVQPTYDAEQSHSDQRWKEEFEPYLNGEDGEIPKLAEPSAWFSGYDRCNI